MGNMGPSGTGDLTVSVSPSPKLQHAELFEISNQLLLGNIAEGWGCSWMMNFFCFTQRRKYWAYFYSSIFTELIDLNGMKATVGDWQLISRWVSFVVVRYRVLKCRKWWSSCCKELLRSPKYCSVEPNNNHNNHRMSRIWSVAMSSSRRCRITSWNRLASGLTFEPWIY